MVLTSLWLAVVLVNVIGDEFCQPVKLETLGFPDAVVPIFSLNTVVVTLNELTVMVIDAALAVVGDAQVAVEVNWQSILSPFAKPLSG